MWNNHDPYSMARWILLNNMPMDAIEIALVTRADDVTTSVQWAVQDLHTLNMLCVMTDGYIRASE